MREKTFNWVTFVSSLSFSLFDFSLFSLLRYFLRTQFEDITYTKYLELACLLFIFIPYLIGITPTSIIDLNKKRSENFTKSKIGKCIIHISAFILNIIVLFIFLNYVSVSLNLHYSIKLIAVSMIIILSYALGTLVLYYTIFMNKKIIEERNKYFLVLHIFIILIMISCYIAFPFLYVSIL